MKDSGDDGLVGGDSEEFCVNYRGRKYEISGFLKNHPGGRDILKVYKGLSLDSAFDNVPHSEAAFHLFQDFQMSNTRAYDDVEVNNINNRIRHFLLDKSLQY